MSDTLLTKKIFDIKNKNIFLGLKSQRGLQKGDDNLAAS